MLHNNEKDVFARWLRADVPWRDQETFRLRLSSEGLKHVRPSAYTRLNHDEMIYKSRVFLDPDVTDGFHVERAGTSRCMFYTRGDAGSGTATGCFERTLVLCVILNVFL